MKAVLKGIRITPKKANLIAGMVRSKDANESIDILRFTPKKAAKILHKLLESAISNAVNNFKQEKMGLNIKEIIVTKGPTLKRGISISRGRVHPRLKRTSNITIILEVKDLSSAKKTYKKVKTEKASETDKKEEKSEKTVEKKLSSTKTSKKVKQSNK